MRRRRIKARRIAAVAFVAATAVLVVGAGRPARSPAPGLRLVDASQCPGGDQGSATCLIQFVAGVLGPKCPAAGSSPASAPAASAAAARLATLIEDVPCPSSGRAVYGAHDKLGEGLDVLDPIRDPRGGYLGVYHDQLDIGGHHFQVCLGHSSDLIHWTRLAVLDDNNGSMPTLRPIPGNAGFLLAYEHPAAPAGQHGLRIRYYATEDGLLANRFAAQRDLPRAFSPYGDGTPSFLAIDWRGGLRRSWIELGFHYEPEVDGDPGPDREALGVLVGMRRWLAYRDQPIDRFLTEQGFAGDHGDRREFRFGRQRWRVYEAQTEHSEIGNWRVILYDTVRRQMIPLTMRTASGSFSGSFGNPIVQIEPAPKGPGQVLVVTMFQFSPGRRLAPQGELIYYQPLP